MGSQNKYTRWGVERSTRDGESKEELCWNKEFVGDSLVHIPLIKTTWRVPKFSNRLTRSFFTIVASTIIDQVYSVVCTVHYGHSWFLMNFLIMHYSERLFLVGIVWLDLQQSFSSFKIIYQELKSGSQTANICHTSYC